MIWSQWAKPVLFAHMPGLAEAVLTDDPIPDLPWAPKADGHTAIVLDLPKDSGVWIGLSLAQRGFRPVPLYNAAPGPPDSSLVDVWPIVHALAGGTELLHRCRPPWGAPPAFLLDANRRGAGAIALPGRYDNRSISFPTDFPGAYLLLSRGIRRALLVVESGAHPQADLAHTLRRWQEAGIEIHLLSLISGLPAGLIEVKRPAFYGWVWHRLLTTFGLRRNPLGGFGGTLPEPSAG